MEIVIALIWSVWGVIKIIVSNPLLLAFALLGIANKIVHK